MNTGKKWPPQAHARQQQTTRQPNRPHAPGVLQPKPAAPRAAQTPPAPPAYRPQPVPKVLQRKAVTPPPSAAAAKSAPAAPPAYRPQPTPRVLQRKAAVPPRAAPLKPAVAPSAPRPAQGVLQKKTARQSAVPPPRGQQKTAGAARPAPPGPPRSAPAGPPTRPVIQRLAYMTDRKILYAPSTWLNETVSIYNPAQVQTTQTIGTLLGGDRKAQVLREVNSALGTAATDIVVQDDPDNLGLCTSEQSGKNPCVTSLRILKKALKSHVKLAKFRESDVYYPYIIERDTEHILRPQDLFPEPDDLNPDTYHDSTVCALVALVSGEGGLEGTREWLSQKGINPKAGKKSTLTALHKYYRQDRGILYDDTSSHMKLYKEHGYRLIFSGKTTWRGVIRNSQLLKMGRRYIFDIEGHTILGELRKALPKTLAPGDEPKDYIRLYNDPVNYPLEIGEGFANSDEKAFSKKVTAIFEK